MADEDPKYTAWLRTLSCCMCGKRGTEAHHKTGAGMALRAHDHEAMPLCRACHRELHALNGRFKGWGRLQLTEFQGRQVATHRELYGVVEDVIDDMEEAF